MARNRGSLVDTITLKEFVFYYEPKVKQKETTTYGKQNVLGHRLPNYMWVGAGDSSVELEAYLIEEVFGVKYMIEELRKLMRPQDDIGAPHPVYVNVGGMYVGKRFVLCELDTDVQTFHIEDTMSPFEAKVKLKLEEIPSGRRFTGAGAKR